MPDQALLQQVIKTALASGGDFADVFVERKRMTAISCEGGKIERIQSGQEAGAGIRVLSQNKTAYAYTNDLTPEGLIKAANIVSHAVESGAARTDFTPAIDAPKVDFKIAQMPHLVDTQQKVQVVKAVDQAARSVDQQKIKQVMVIYGDVVQDVTIANSLGEYVQDRRVRTRLVVQVVAAQGDQMQTGFESVGSHSGFELLAGDKPAQIAMAAARRAVQMLEARPAPAGCMPVVLAGEAGGTMVHEACGHGLEADLVQKNLSVYAGKIGQKVAADGVSVIDDATMPDQYGSYSVDDEGVTARKVVLIENGILKNFLYDRLTAQREGVTPNGHGRRQSYQHKPIPRMANTYIAPGEQDPQAIIQQTRHGLLVKKMGGGQVNTTTGDFVFDVAEGYLIQDGQVGPMVRGATLTGNGPQVLQMIEAIGNDLGFTIGTCGKDGQGVPVSDAQPTIKIKELVVGGTGHGDDS